MKTEVIDRQAGKLKMWNGSELQPKGVTSVAVKNPKCGREYILDFVVVEQDLLPILGIDATHELGFLHFNHSSFVHSLTVPDELVQQYPTVFNGNLGKFAGQANLSINNEVIPVALPARRVPSALREQLHK